MASAAPAVAQVTTRTDEVGKRLNEWFQAGTAAGLGAITYENRDGGHSPLNAAEWPQLKVYAPSDAEKGANAHMGPAGAVRQMPLIGNCSMSAPADRGGSLPRLYFIQPQGFLFLTNQYLNTNLFVYPEHQDYDPGWNGVGGYGDLYTANTPFCIIAQGSSYQDQPFVRAFLSATVALPPDTQAALIKSRALMPALQSIFRRSNKMVQSEEDYFTGKAHPPVFDPAQIDEARMVELAHQMKDASIPPVTLLNVVREGTSTAGRDYFEMPSVNSEVVGTSPCGIARIYRRSAANYEITVSARQSGTIKKMPLKIKWVLLQGDPQKVKITPSSPDASEATINVGWHPEMRAATGIQTHRVDIGVFAGNGTAWSAPAFISFYMLPNEMRFLDEKGRVQEICYENGNPDPGIPPPTDLRWLALARRSHNERKSLAMGLLAKGLSEEALVRMKALADEFAPQQEKWRELAAEPAKKTEAEAAEKKLKEDLRKRLEAPEIGGKHSLIEAMYTAIDTLASSPDMFVALQEDLMGLARKSSKGTAVQDIMAARKRLLDWGVLLGQEDIGRVELIADEERLTAGDKHHLKQFHLTVLSQAVLPEFLDRSVAPAYVDQRLTSPKNWRDIHLYDKEGAPIGWMRRANGRRFEFNMEGKLLPEGRGGKAVDVEYKRDPATGRLLFGPK
ncbi:hypothetical protein DES53_11318 [Roseimicrobium gellanilyticum]|uniref:Uncharacterized protein n=1 Tax=Roseimicrobium gellanilyticum TaxID=748857 RepID=A0A366H7U7_9BACT|nr:hypothetical protein [Roseimicrobium gellanilyticum]RBP37636.1 hypothetical protein DES53_11318 [Roseimicrobium gellanilyticum]